MDTLGRLEWARRFALRLRALNQRWTPEDAFVEGERLHERIGEDMSPEEAAEALAFVPAL